MNIVSLNDHYDFKELSFTSPRNNVSGGQSVFIRVNDNKFMIRTMKCRLPFGVNENKGKKSIDLSIDQEKEKDFYKQLDVHILNEAVKNSEVWFKKKLNETVVRELYKPTLRDNEKFPPLVRMSLPTNEDSKFIGEIYDMCENIVGDDSLKIGSYVQVIAELNGLYFVPKGFGLNWKIVQIKVFPIDKINISGFAFLDEDTMDDAEPN